MIDPLFSQRFPLEILVVDDDAISRFIAKTYLRKLGYKPHLVEGGSEAIVIASNRSFELILMNIHMPKMNGIETAMQIRKNIGTGSYIVAFTALDRGDVSNVGNPSCFSAYLSKPLKLYELKNILKDAAIPHYQSRSSTF